MQWLTQCLKLSLFEQGIKTEELRNNENQHSNKAANKGQPEGGNGRPYNFTALHNAPNDKLLWIQT